MISRLDVNGLEAMQHARERLTESGFFAREMVGDRQQILPDDVGRNPDLFGICPVQQLKVFAEVRFSHIAEEAPMTRGRVGSHDAHPGSEPLHPFAYFNHNARKLMTERGGEAFEEDRMPSLIRLVICPTR